LAKLSPLEIWHSRIDLEQEIKQLGNSDLRRQLVGVIAKARGKGLSKDDNFPHLVSGDNPKIVDKPPTIFHLDPKANARHRLGAVSEISEGEALSDYAQLCGRTLARAHARSGDPAAIAGYTGKSDALDDAIASFATAYADQTSADHAALVKAKGTKPTATKKAKAA